MPTLADNNYLKQMKRSDSSCKMQFDIIWNIHNTCQMPFAFVYLHLLNIIFDLQL